MPTQSASEKQELSPLRDEPVLSLLVINSANQPL